MRAINFKASARGFSGGVRQLMSNDYDSSRNYNSMILLDLTAYPDTAIGEEEQIEVGLRYACYLFSEALKNGGNVGFAANCAVGARKFIKTPCAAGGAHVKSVLRCLSQVNYYSRRDFSFDSLILRVAEEMSAGTDLYLITPYVDSKAGETVRRLESGGVNVCLIPLR